MKKMQSRGKKILIFFLLAALVFWGFYFKPSFLKKEAKIKAAPVELTDGGYIGTEDHNPDDDLTLKDGTYTMDGEHSLKSLKLSNATLIHQAADKDGNVVSSPYTNHFSARFEGSFVLECPYYYQPKLGISHDDGVKVWLDNNLVYDKWNQQGPGSGWIKTTRGSHQVIIEYKEIEKDARLSINAGFGEFRSFNLSANYFKDENLGTPWTELNPENLVGGNTSILIDKNWGQLGPKSETIKAGLKLNVAEDIRLENSKIDVSEKGYPGGHFAGDNKDTREVWDEGKRGYGGWVGDDPHVDKRGGGPGGAPRCATGSTGCWDTEAGGGSYGGRGIAHASGEDLRSETYGNKKRPDLSDPTPLGSGGGAGRSATHHPFWCTCDDKKGGAGGGFISIVGKSLTMDSASKIKANGAIGSGGEGGSGSGGTVFIDLRKGLPDGKGYLKNENEEFPSYWGGSNAEDGTYYNGGQDELMLDRTGNFGSNIQAKGGYSSRGGGGGRIAIYAKKPVITITKDDGKDKIAPGEINTYDIKYTIVPEEIDKFLYVTDESSETVQLTMDLKKTTYNSKSIRGNGIVRLKDYLKDYLYVTDVSGNWTKRLDKNLNFTEGDEVKEGGYDIATDGTYLYIPLKNSNTISYWDKDLKIGGEYDNLPYPASGHSVLDIGLVVDEDYFYVSYVDHWWVGNTQYWACRLAKINKETRVGEEKTILGPTKDWPIYDTDLTTDGDYLYLVCSAWISGDKLIKFDKKDLRMEKTSEYNFGNAGVGITYGDDNLYITSDDGDWTGKFNPNSLELVDPPGKVTKDQDGKGGEDITYLGPLLTYKIEDNLSRMIPSQAEFLGASISDGTIINFPGSPWFPSPDSPNTFTVPGTGMTYNKISHLLTWTQLNTDGNPHTLKLKVKVKDDASGTLENCASLKSDSVSSISGCDPEPTVITRVTISGDIYAATLGKQLKEADIIAWKNLTVSDKALSASWKIGNYAYTSDWGSKFNEIKNYVEDLLLKYGKLAPRKAIDNSIDPTNLNPNNLNLPEGEIYYVDTGGTIYGNIGGKGTIVIKSGDLTISGDLKNSNSNSSLGIIVSNGNITIGSSVNNLDGAYLASGNIIFDSTDEEMWFSGHLGASKITLTKFGSFSYNPNLVSNPPPGFRKIFEILGISEVAP